MLVKHTILFALSIFVLFMSSCIKEYDLELDDSKPHVVIEGLISDSVNLSYVRVTLSKSSLSASGEGNWQNDGTTPINNAIVIINDDMGNSDTLKSAPQSDAPFDLYYQKGYYNLSHLRPVAEHTYFLTVRYDNQTYKAQSYMPALPKVDSVSFKFNNGETGKNDYYIPYIFFKDNSDKKNYYLFTTGESYSNVWCYSVLSDKYLKDYVNGIDVFHGQSNLYWRDGYPMPGEAYYISMQSLTKEAYDYYDCLIKLFSNDGGTYKPAPASPVTNIDNNALGFFRASSAKIFKGQLPY
jgi:hypothetical protein